MGLSDLPGVKSVKLYCPKCEDLYNPKSSRHAAIDGAYFGSSFHNILFQVYPALVPPKSKRRFEPRVFGFKVHAAAALARWQDEQRRQMRKRLKEAGVVEDGKMFTEDTEGDNGIIVGSDEGMAEGEQDGMVVVEAAGNGGEGEI